MTRTAALLLGTVTMIVATGPAAGQTVPTVMERSITVLGEGSVNAAPDLAIVRAGVTTQGKTAGAASEANNRAMTAVIAAIKESGIAEKDIQTTYFSINPLHDTRQGGGSRITGFQASNQVSVKMRTIGKVADLLDRIIGAGANQISGIQFTVAEPSKFLDQARAIAVVDARRKAEILAKAAGVRLGRATIISEEGAAPPRPVLMRAAQAAPSTPIAIGEETLRVSVGITFELLH